jgi:hypothetical protein
MIITISWKTYSTTKKTHNFLAYHPQTGYNISAPSRLTPGAPSGQNSHAIVGAVALFTEPFQLSSGVERCRTGMQGKRGRGPVEGSPHGCDWNHWKLGIY